MNKHFYFITGTDTGVGKTVVAGAIALHLRARGVKVGVMKPAETGCRVKGGELIPADAAFLKKVAGSDDALELICPYRFSEALAPSVAARRAGEKINIKLIKKNFDAISANNDVVIVEGAGGIMVPLRDKYLYLDLAEELGLPVVIVGRAGLGTINHTLLTVNAIRARNLEISAIILNQGTKKSSGIAEETNADEIRALSGINRVFSLPYMPGGAKKRETLIEVGEQLESKGFFDLTKKNGKDIISRKMVS